jgi:hypothetical protein
MFFTMFKYFQIMRKLYSNSLSFPLLLLYRVPANKVYSRPSVCYDSEHRKMRAKQQHVCKGMNQYTKMYDQYQPEMDSKFRHRMDNRSEVQEIAFYFE